MGCLRLITVLLIVSCCSSFCYGQSDAVSFKIARFSGDKKAAISYTFDDGLEEHFTLVYPKLKELDFKATFWINGNTINQGEKGLQKEKPRVSWEDLKTMAEDGQEISNHGWSHLNLTRISLDEARQEISKNDSILELKIGEKPTTFCYAFNSKNQSIIEMASEGRVGTRTGQIALGSKSTSIGLDKMVDELITNKKWGVMMIHGITYGWDAFKDQHILWDHLDDVKKLENEIWVAPFRDVSAYLEEQENIQLNIEKKGRRWIIKTTNDLEESLFSYPLTMIVQKENMKRIRVKQNRKKIPVRLLKNKALFDFHPNGNKILVSIK